jgi:hypothetical protein
MSHRSNNNNGGGGGGGGVDDDGDASAAQRSALQGVEVAMKRAQMELQVTFTKILSISILYTHSLPPYHIISYHVTE